MFKTFCDFCNAEIAYSRKRNTVDRCRSCSAKQASRNRQSKPFVKSLSISSHPNVDFNDFKHMKCGVKKYRISCIGCGTDKGHGALATSKQLCRSCMGKKLSAKNSPNIRWEDNVRAECGRRRYGMSCVSCSKDRGYCELKSFDSTCFECQKLGIRRDRNVRKKIKSSMKSSMYHRLKKRLLNKSRKKTFDMLPYTIDDLMRHLESKFQPGMTWDNYGTWHIDHRVPDSWFQYGSMTDPDFLKSWSLDNLQPKWASENISKGNRYSE